MPRPPKPTPTKPRSFPDLGYGGGTLRWDDKRKKVELRHVIDGTRYRERADTVAEAKAARDARRAQLKAAAPLANNEAPLAALWAAWDDFHGTKAPKTKEGYDRSLVIVSGYITCPCGRIEAPMIESMLVALRNADYSASSIAKVRSHLNMVLDYGVRHHYLAVNPMRSIRTPGGVKGARQVKWFNEDGFIRLREYLTTHPTPQHTAMLVSLLCGLRPGETLGLRWDAVDFEQGLITVRTAVQRYAGGRREQIVDTLKTKHSYRTVRMPLDLSVALQRLQREQARVAISPDVFTNLAGKSKGKVMSTNALEWAMGKACTAIGHEALSPNSLRHTNASMLLHRGMTAQAVAKHLGHKNTLMVTTTYGHAMVDIVDTAAALAI